MFVPGLIHTCSFVQANTETARGKFDASTFVSHPSSFRFSPAAPWFCVAHIRLPSLEFPWNVAPALSPGLPAVAALSRSLIDLPVLV